MVDNADRADMFSEDFRFAIIEFFPVVMCEISVLILNWPTLSGAQGVEKVCVR